jgi:aryl-alcohol dehydrogenase-like predicted oxidoreductase
MSMRLRPFGRTGLMVSPFTLGTMEFGSKVDESVASQLLDWVVDAGVNVVDTANVYTSGRSEEIVGRLIAGKRDRLILATKFSVHRVTVPYYLDDSFAHFRPQPFRW